MLTQVLKWFKIRKTDPEPIIAAEKQTVEATPVNTMDLDIRPDDPILAYLLGVNGVV